MPVEIDFKKNEEVKSVKWFVSKLKIAAKVSPLDDNTVIHPDILLETEDKKIGIEVVHPRNESRMAQPREAISVRHGTDDNHVLENIKRKIEIYAGQGVQHKTKNGFDEIWLLVHGGTSKNLATELVLYKNEIFKNYLAELINSFNNISFNKIYLFDTIEIWELDKAKNFVIEKVYSDLDK